MRSFSLTHKHHHFLLLLLHTIEQSKIYIHNFVFHIGSNQESIQAMFKQVIDDYGTCDVLVNNAGITADGLVMRMKPKQWQDVIDINLTGVFYTT
jgi:NAD(P)-dependent dehydrogenase (short-subunit alcohol dehydrogenase family)